MMFIDRVMETSTTTGASQMFLDGAVDGYQAFVDAVPADTFFPYLIEAVDGSGVPTGQWETGYGFWHDEGSSVYSFNRQSFRQGSSGDGANVSFSAGTKRISLCLPSNFAVPAIRTFPLVATTSQDYTTETDLWIEEVESAGVGRLYPGGNFEHEMFIAGDNPFIGNRPYYAFTEVRAQVSLTGLTAGEWVKLRLYFNDGGGYDLIASTVGVATGSAEMFQIGTQGLIAGNKDDSYKLSIEVEADTTVSVDPVASKITIQGYCQQPDMP